MTEKPQADTWVNIEKEVETRSRKKDIERIKMLTGIDHCQQCGQPIRQGKKRCSICGFTNG